MPNDNDGLLAGLGIVGLGLLGVVAWLVSGDSGTGSGSGSGVETQSSGAPTAGELRDLAGNVDSDNPVPGGNESVAPPSSPTGVVGTIRRDLGGDDGIVNESDAPGLTARERYLAELYDTDTGE